MQFVKQLFVILLSVSAVLYSGGVRVASHYCNGKVVAKSLNLKVEKCAKDNVTVPFSEHPLVSKKSCCDTEIGYSKSSDYETNASLEIPLQATVTHNVTAIEKNIFRPHFQTKNLRPPPRSRSLHKVYECFLI